MPPVPSPPPLLLRFALGFAVGCGGDPPVLPGVPLQPLLVEPAARTDAGDTEPVARSSRTTNPDYYEKPDAVWVDVMMLGGRPWRDVRGEVANQFGALAETIQLPGDSGTEMRFARGTVRVADDRIFMLRVPLPEPMRRGPALEAIGFPPYTGKYLEMHREYRLNNERGFRRLRMMRLDRQSELVTEVEAWHWIPGEHGRRH
jgi:hypothetical protein